MTWCTGVSNVLVGFRIESNAAGRLIRFALERKNRITLLINWLCCRSEILNVVGGPFLFR